MTMPPGAETAYQVRKHQAFAALRVGDVITVDLEPGRRTEATVLMVTPPDVIARTADGAEHVITVQVFAALRRRPEGGDP